MKNQKLKLEIIKNLKFLAIAFFAAFAFVSCSDEDDAPEPETEEEVITTMTVTLTPDDGGMAITLKTQDLDGDGSDEPEVTVSGNLTAGVTYTGSIELLNETEDPAEDITEEVEEADDEHQFFYTPGGGLDITTAYTNFDSNNNPLGTEFTLTANSAGSGTLTFTLRHEPTKPNTGLDDAEGETDIEATFDITIESAI